MYEQIQRLSILFLRSTEKIYARASVRVTLYANENIPYPSADDIIVTDRGSLGKDIEIRLRVNGTDSGTSKTESLTIPVEIIDAGEELDEQGVRDAIGTKVYNVTTAVLKDGIQKDSKSGVLNNNSKVEIE